jgi:DNA repair photolyase
LCIFTIVEAMLTNDKNNEYTKGRGAQFNPANKFATEQYVRDFSEGIDDWERNIPKTDYIPEEAKGVVNKVDSPDVPMLWSVNPYQGCEHGCIYCYARPTHEYLGYSAGTDFESKIIVKHNAAQLLKETFEKASWQPNTISLSGNTDCYQPAERKFKLTREILKTCLEYRNPVGIITKNALILRDLDILQELQKLNLIKVYTSITSTNEKLRLQLEPRTSTYSDRFKVLEILSQHDIPTGIMNAPIIPGLNDADMHDVLKQAKDAGARWAGYTLVRLNGAVQEIFKDWLEKTFPDRANKILNFIADTHGGQLNDSRTKTRMSGEGEMAAIIEQQFKLFQKKFNYQKDSLELNTNHFVRKSSGQMRLF